MAFCLPWDYPCMLSKIKKSIHEYCHFEARHICFLIKSNLQSIEKVSLYFFLNTVLFDRSLQ